MQEVFGLSLTEMQKILKEKAKLFDEEIQVTTLYLRNQIDK